MQYLCRIYIPQKDKANIIKNTLDEALELLGQTLDNLKEVHPIIADKEYHFNNTKNYIRIIN